MAKSNLSRRGDRWYSYQLEIAQLLPTVNVAVLHERYRGRVSVTTSKHLTKCRQWLIREGWKIVED